MCVYMYLYMHAKLSYTKIKNMHLNVAFEKIERDLDICAVGHESIFSYEDMKKEVKKKYKFK